MSRLFLIVALLFSAHVGAEEASHEVDNKAYWICKNKHEVRTIRVHVLDSGACQTFYSKSGDEKQVGTAKNHDSCLNVLNNIKGNLEKSNWACRDITSTKITAEIN